MNRHLHGARTASAQVRVATAHVGSSLGLYELRAVRTGIGAAHNLARGAARCERNEVIVGERIDREARQQRVAEVQRG